MKAVSNNTEQHHCWQSYLIMTFEMSVYHNHCILHGLVVMIGLFSLLQQNEKDLLLSGNNPPLLTMSSYFLVYASRGGFRVVSEVSRNHSGFSLDDGCAPFGYNVSRGIQSRLNSGISGLCFGSKLRKCSEDLFFGCHKEKLETFAKICVAASLETQREDPTARVRDKQAVWKLLSKISRTAPVC